MKVITIQRHQQYEDSNTTDVTKHGKPIELAEIVDYIAEHKYHFTETLMNYAILKMENVDGSSKRISKDDVENYINIHGYKHPVKSNIYDIQQTWHMLISILHCSILLINVQNMHQQQLTIQMDMKVQSFADIQQT